MISLRRATTTSLAIAFSALALFGGIAAYRSASQESNEFLDEQQRQIARYVGDLSAASLTDDVSPPHDAEDDYVIEITYADGRPARSSGSTTIIPDEKSTGFSEFKNAVGEWRVFSLVSRDRTVQVAQQMLVRRELAADAAIRTVLPFALAVPLSWLIVTFVVRRIFRRLEDLSRDIADREPTDHSPIQTDGLPSEFRPVVVSFNQLLVRLRDLMDQQRNFLSDAAHELRTPLAALTIQIGNLREASRDAAQYDTRLSELEAGARRVSSLTSQLLRVARYEADDTLQNKENVSIDELAKEVVASLLPQADNQLIDVGFSELQRADVKASRADLRALLEILIENAVRYTPPNGKVDVSVQVMNGRTLVAVSDTGPGVAEHLIPRLTERFFRVSNAEANGSGLGLAIAKAISKRQGIGMQLSNRTDQRGFRAQLSFDE